MKHSSIRIVRVLGALWLLALAGVANAQSQLPTTNPVTVYGRVVNPEGKPVSGAVVLLTGVASSATTRPGVLNSDVQGRFSIPGVDREALVMIKAPGLGIMPVRIYETSTNDPAEIWLSAATQLRLRLIGPDAKPAAGIKLMVQTLRNCAGESFEIPPEMAGEFTQVSDAAGEIRFADLPRGATLFLRIMDERYAAILATSSTDAILLTEAPTTDAGEFRLEPAASVQGRVVIDGTPSARLPGIKVQATRRGDNPFNSVISTVTDAQGNYVLKQLSGAAYDVSIYLEPPLSRVYTARPIDVVLPDPGQEITGRDFALIRGQSITGRMTVRGSNQPLANIPVGMANPSGSPRAQTAAMGRSEQDGSYFLRALPGPADVSVSTKPLPGLIAPAASRRGANLAQGRSATINFVFISNPYPDVKGRVVDESGKPVGGATVLFESSPNPEMASNQLSGEVITDALGRFGFPGAVDGARLRARKANLATLSPAPIVRDRNMTLVLKKEGGGSLLVVVSSEGGGPVPDAHIFIIQRNDRGGRGGRGGVYALTDKDGKSKIDSLFPDTSYSLEITAPGHAKMAPVWLQVQAGKQTEMKYTLGKGTSFVGGLVLDAGGMPVPDVELSISGSSSSAQRVKTDINGRFRAEGIVAGENVLISVYAGNRPAGINTRALAGTENAVLTLTTRSTPAGP